MMQLTYLTNVEAVLRYGRLGKTTIERIDLKSGTFE
jgi:hypothetical protein